MPDSHKWVTVGEDTGGFVEWCEWCGAIKDSGGNITYRADDLFCKED